MTHLSCPTKYPTARPLIPPPSTVTVFIWFLSFEISRGSGHDGCVEHGLAAIERFCVPARRRRFDAPQPQQREKGLRGEPVPVLLGLKHVHDVADFPVARLLVQVHEHVRDAEIA